MLSKLIAPCVFVASAVSAGLAGASSEIEELQEGLDSDYVDEEGRLLVPVVVTSALSLANATAPLSPFLGALLGLATGLLTLLGLGALGFLLYSLLAKDDGGYGSSSGGGYGGGYSSYSSYRRSFDPYSIDWSQFSILDWIAIGQETWQNFEVADLECQKRLICEVHQNAERFGTTAKKMVDLLGYLELVEYLRLPDEVKAIVDEYLDAADRGRSSQKDCGELFTCPFSVKKMVEKYSHNEI
ncbi:uncharacterized protein LOC143027929 [Oratosquilla oratoria]|uniref:uncharacterized protein LOC143027929 n=1 Tax=Oratosquilla oratoria TaxID=337810 RepID=UPI003F7698B7